MTLIITLTQAGSSVSGLLDLYSNYTGQWTFLESVDKNVLLGGYSLQAPEGTSSIQVRDTGNCGTILTLLCEGVTTTTSTTLTTTTTQAPVLDPFNIKPPHEGGSYQVTIYHFTQDVSLTAVVSHPWITASISEELYVYSANPLTFYHIMNVDVGENTENLQRIGEVNVLSYGEQYGNLAIEQAP